MRSDRSAPRRAALVWAAAASLAAAGAAGAEDGGSKVLQKKLPNGLEIVVEESRGAPVVAVQMWVRVGSADESEEDAGLAHVLEHMLFKGTKRRGVGAIAKEIDALGGDINAYTSYDQTVYHAVVAARYAERALDIIGDAALNSTLDAEELRRETKVVLEELYRSLDSPGSRSWNKLMETAYRTHTYRRPIIGYARTIEAMTREQLVAFYKKWYAPNNMTLIVSGDVNAEETMEKAAKMFAPYKAGADPHRTVPPEPAQTEPRFAAETAPIQNDMLKAGWHIPALGHEDAYALDVLSVILGSGKSSRLYRNVKDGRGLARAVSAYALTPKQPGLLTLSATVDGADPAETAEAMLAETYRFRREGPSPEEMEKARRNLEVDFVFGKETAQGRAGSLGSSVVTAGDIDFERRYLERVRAVTPEELRRVARKYLTPGNLTMTLLQPKAREKPLGEEALRAAAARAWEKASAEEKPEARPPEASPPEAAMPAAPEAPAAAPGELPKAAAKTPAKKAGTAAAAPAGPERVKLYDLPGGGKLIVRRNPEVPTFAFQLAFLGGSRFEPAERQGLANAAALMITRGTAKRTAAEIAEEVERLGGQLSGFSGYNTFGLQGSFLSKDLDAAMELLGDVAANPSFPEAELDKVRRDVLTDLKTRADDPGQTALRLMREGVYGKDHPYGRELLGTPETVAALASEGLARYWRTYARSPNLVASLVGDVNPEAAAARVKAALAPIFSEAPVPAPEARPAAYPDAPRKLETALHKEQTHIAVAYPGIRFTDPDRYALGVLAAAMRGMGGRLFLQLRDKQSLAYVVSAQNASGIEPGAFFFYMASSPEKVQEALAGLDEQIASLREKGLAAEELARAKTSTVGGYEIDLQSNGAQARDMAFNQLYGLGWDEFRRFPARTEAVTREDALRVARKYLDPAREARVLVKAGGPPPAPEAKPDAPPPPAPPAPEEEEAPASTR